MDLKPYEAMAKLNLPEAERLELSAQAEAFLQSLAAMERVDTTDVEPLVSVLDGDDDKDGQHAPNVLREDVVRKDVSREKLLENAPEQYDGYFQVPKTLD